MTGGGTDHEARWTRRRFLGAGGGVLAAALAGGEVAAQTGPTASQVLAALRPEIQPRTAWAPEPGPVGLPVEAPGDVRFLLVHHTASGNDYRPEEVPGLLRGFHQLHTGPERGWPDVAYNFFVDRHGTIWEGRSGSIDAPVRGDATGGSQGFAQLCCLVGDHHAAPPTAEALDALVRLLAWLGARYGIDTAPGAVTAFTSRGSNRWPAGVEVSAQTISGHRDMSMTLCPGDHLYPMIARDLPAAVTAQRRRAAVVPPSTPDAEPTPTEAEVGRPTGLRAGSETTAGVVRVQGSSPWGRRDGVEGALLSVAGISALGAAAAAVALVHVRNRGGS